MMEERENYWKTLKTDAAWSPNARLIPTPPNDTIMAMHCPVAGHYAAR